MCEDCEPGKWNDVIQAILDHGVSDSDQAFLESVSEWIDENSHVTQAQVEKIKEKADLVGIDYE